MEIPWLRRSEVDAWEGMRGLTAAEYKEVAAGLRARGLEGTPQYAAWLRTELTKAALRKRAMTESDESSAVPASTPGHAAAA